MKYASILSFIIIFSVVSRFYNLAWGAPYFFHPDERNIASSVSQLNTKTLHPHFFAYGSLPIYSIYAVGITSHALRITHEVEPFTVSFDQAIIIGRIFSAIFSLLTIFLLFIIGKKIHSETVGLLTAFFAATSIGLIQYAHFATFEMWLTFFSLLLAYLVMMYIQHQTKKNLLFQAVVLGILISIKISSLVLFSPVILAICIIHLKEKMRWYKRFGNLLVRFFFIVCISFLIFFITNPFTILDTQEFLSSITYETQVATGQLPVFYTQGFTRTTPVIYQLVYIYPFLLNNFFAIFTIPLLLYALFITFRDRKYVYLGYFLFFMILFFSQAVLFVKWARYMVPTLPYMYLFVTIGFVSLINDIHSMRAKKILITLGVTVCILSSILSTYFLFLVYTHDSRIDAYHWAEKNIPHDRSILSEVYDLGIIPFNGTFENIALGNFYEIEQDDSLEVVLKKQIEESDYIILPSQRIIKSRTLHPTVYPKSAQFYSRLSDNHLYKKIYETPCNNFCQVLYSFDPMFHTEETVTVFDRPIVQIYKKL